MSANPINLAVRFLLEIVALLAIGAWGWQQHEGWKKYALAIGLPILAALIWGMFRVPNDPGPAVVAVSGMVRLIIEFGLFALAVWALFSMHYYRLAWAMAIVTLVHYLVSYDRIAWLLTE